MKTTHGFQISYAPMSTPPPAAPVWHLYVPKLITVGVRPDGRELQLAANFAEALTLAGGVR